MSDATKPTQRQQPALASAAAPTAVAPTPSSLAAKSGGAANPITIYVGGLGPRTGTTLVAVLVLYLLGTFVMPALATGARAIWDALPH